MFDCNKEIKAFHDEKVTLTANDRTDMRGRRDSGRVRLDKGLGRDGHALPSCHSQGSYAMHTMVQDDTYDYDIDDGAYFKRKDLQGDGGRDLTPDEAKKRVCSALNQDDRLAYDAEIHDNCVRQRYPKGYHIDIPVYRINAGEDDDGNSIEWYELASSKGWVKSDAREVTRWFTRAVSDAGDDNGRQLRHVVRLTKAFARSRPEWKEETASGILLTTLVQGEFVAVPGRDDESLRTTLQRISKRLANSLIVGHPVNDGNLSDANDKKATFFRDKLKDALKTLEILDGNPTRSEARKAWDDVFNTSFFSKQPTPKSGSDGGGDAVKGSMFIVDETKSDRRNDGNGSYG